MNRRDFLKGGLAGAFGAFLTRAGVARAEEAVVEDIAPYADFHAKLDDLARRVVEASARHKALYPEEWAEEPTTYVHVECPFLPDQECDDCPSNDTCWSEDEIAQVSDNVSWDHSAVTGGAPSERRIDGIIEVRTKGGFSEWVCWSCDGSDENGTGTHDDPVATQACAQSIADNLG